MVTEIYSKGVSEADYLEDKFDEHNPLEIYIQQIKTIFTNKKNSVMGALDMSVDIESLIYEFNLNEKQIIQQVREKLQLYATFYDEYRTDINIRFFKGKNRDIAYLDIIVEKNNRVSFFIK